ncbi:MAG: hypothetical protein V1738_01565, partial [Patescibacteria group bacterium]
LHHQIQNEIGDAGTSPAATLIEDPRGRTPFAATMPRYLTGLPYFSCPPVRIYGHAATNVSESR